MWQDFVFSIGSIVFCIALMPTILGKAKPPLLTAAPIALVLFIFALTYASLNLWFASTTTLLTSVLWTIVATQVVLGRKHKH